MPNVTMRHQISGTRNGRKWPQPGQSLLVSDAEVRALVRNGHAVLSEGSEGAAEGRGDSVEADTADTGDTEAEAEDDSAAEAEAEGEALEDLTLLQLREVAKAKGLSSAGKKAELIERIRGE